MRQINNITIISLFLTLLIGQSNRETLIPGSDRSEGQGPFKRMVIRGATMINGNGSPPVGPVDIVIEKNRITEVKSVGYPGVESVDVLTSSEKWFGVTFPEDKKNVSESILKLTSNGVYPEKLF